MSPAPPVGHSEQTSDLVQCTCGRGWAVPLHSHSGAWEPAGAIMFQAGLYLTAEGQVEIAHHMGEAVRDQAWKWHPSFMPHSMGWPSVT